MLFVSLSWIYSNYHSFGKCRGCPPNPHPIISVEFLRGRNMQARRVLRHITVRLSPSFLRSPPPRYFVEVFAYVLNLAYTFYVPYNADVRIVFPYKYVGGHGIGTLSLHVGCCCCMEGSQHPLSINIHLQLAIMMKQTLIVAALVASASAFAPSRCVFFCCYESEKRFELCMDG